MKKDINNLHRNWMEDVSMMPNSLDRAIEKGLGMYRSIPMFSKETLMNMSPKAKINIAKMMLLEKKHENKIRKNYKEKDLLLCILSTQRLLILRMARYEAKAKKEPFDLVSVWDWDENSFRSIYDISNVRIEYRQSCIEIIKLLGKLNKIKCEILGTGNLYIAAKDLFEAGMDYERIPILEFDERAKAGVKVKKGAMDSGKLKSKIFAVDRPKYQGKVNEYLKRNPSHSYCRAACEHAGKFFNVSSRTIRRYTKNPKRTT